MQSIKFKNIVFLIILCLLLTFLFGYNSTNVEHRKIENMSEISELDLKNGYYYFGRPDCIECIKFQKELNNVLKTRNINVKYVNTAYWKQFDEFNNFLKNESINSVPQLIYYKNNIEINRISDKSSIKSNLNN